MNLTGGESTQPAPGGGVWSDRHRRFRLQLTGHPSPSRPRLGSEVDRLRRLMSPETVVTIVALVSEGGGFGAMVYGNFNGRNDGSTRSTRRTSFVVVVGNLSVRSGTVQVDYLRPGWSSRGPEERR